MGTSDFIASIALAVSVLGLFVSIFSVLYAKRQSQSAHIDAQNSYRAQLTEAHRYYYQKVLDVEEKHAGELRDLMSLASDALSQVIVLADSYDREVGSHPYMRHLLHEASEMIFVAFKGQMGWQAGLNLLHRAQAFKRFEVDHDLAKSADIRTDFRNATRFEYFKDRDKWQEQDLLINGNFHRLVHLFSKRLKTEFATEFSDRVDKIIYPIKKKHAGIREAMLQSSEELGRILREGERAHFSLRESPQIFNRLSHRKATLNTLSCFTVHSDSANADPLKYLYICFVLHAFSDFSSWGWEHRDLL